MKSFMEKHLIHFLAVACFFILIIVWNLGLEKLISSVELLTYDWRAQIATDKGPLNEKFMPADTNIVILSADDLSFSKLDKYSDKLGIGRWPWKRKTWASVVDYVQQGNPRAIIFDIKFEGIEGNSKENQNSDNALSKSLKSKNIVLAVAATIDRKILGQKQITEIINQAEKHNVVDKISQNKLDLIIDTIETANKSKTNEKIFLNVNDKEYSSRPLTDQKAKKLFDSITYYDISAIPSIFISQTKAGVVNLDTSGEMLARYNMPLYRIVKNQQVNYLPSLAFSAALSALPEKDKSSIILQKNKIIIGNKRVIPINDDGKVLINWHGTKGTYKFYPVADVILSDAIKKRNITQSKTLQVLNPIVFKDKIVVIGLTAAGTDLHVSPMGYDYPGPEIVATLIDNYLNDTIIGNAGHRKFVHKLPFWVSLILAAFYCFSIGYFNLKAKNYYVSLISSFIIMILYIVSAVALFVHPATRLWIDIILPIGLMIITSFVTYVMRIYNERKNNAAVENLFGKFVSPQILKQILKTPDELKQSNKRKDMTVMFSDIRNFTTMSETISPDILIPQINEYFNEVVDIILENKGTMDKFIGDAVMAFWGDPLPVENHEYMAVKTAIEITQKLKELNEKWESEGKTTFKIGVGVNSGEMIVGYMGSNKIVDYTVIGDNVNLAARLESLNKEYKTEIIISGSTYEKTKDLIKTTYLDEVFVKGKNIAVKIYKVEGFRQLEDENITLESIISL
jgi:adenylate cyclase